MRSRCNNQRGARSAQEVPYKGTTETPIQVEVRCSGNKLVEACYKARLQLMMSMEEPIQRKKKVIIASHSKGWNKNHNRGEKDAKTNGMSRSSDDYYEKEMIKLKAQLNVLM